MVGLTQSSCVPCRGGEPTATEAEIEELHPQVSDWQIIERDHIKRLERVFKFNNFAEALTFTNKVGQLAEMEQHHPSLLTECGKVTVTLWTHKIKGIHKNDFIMATKVDHIYQFSR